MKMG